MSRPMVPPYKKRSKYVMAMLNDEEREGLESLAERKGVTMSGVVRELLRDALYKEDLLPAVNAADV